MKTYSFVMELKVGAKSEDEAIANAENARDNFHSLMKRAPFPIDIHVHIDSIEEDDAP